MLASHPVSLNKKERIYGKKLIDKLFNGGVSRSVSVYPLRVVYLLEDNVDLSVQARMMISVPKRCFKRAVKRNRIKRQVREAYRHNKQILLNKLEETPQKSVSMAFIWQDNKLRNSDEINKYVVNLLERVSEKL